MSRVLFPRFCAGCMDRIGGEVPWRRTGYLPCRLLLLLSILTGKLNFAHFTMLYRKREELEALLPPQCL
jgi:hypothetical protein